MKTTYKIKTASKMKTTSKMKMTSKMKTGTVPANKELLTGMVPVQNLFLEFMQTHLNEMNIYYNILCMFFKKMGLVYFNKMQYSGKVWTTTYTFIFIHWFWI